MLRTKSTRKVKSISIFLQKKIIKQKNIENLEKKENNF